MSYFLRNTLRSFYFFTFGMGLAFVSYSFAQEDKILPPDPPSIKCVRDRLYLERMLMGDQSQIWGFVSTRTKEFQVKKLREMEARLLTVGIRIPAFPYDDIVIGRKSFLSLGEGVPLLTRTMLDDQKLYTGVANHGNIHAVDLAYVPDAIDELQFYVSGEEAGRKYIEETLSEFPRNYHGQAYQDLDLRNPDGSKMIFDEIYSSASLSFVIKNSTQEESIEILERVSSHLAPGGHLRIIGVEASYISMIQKIMPILKSKGLFTSLEMNRGNAFLTK